MHTKHCIAFVLTTVAFLPFVDELNLASETLGGPVWVSTAKLVVVALQTGMIVMITFPLWSLLCCGCCRCGMRRSGRRLLLGAPLLLCVVGWDHCDWGGV